jgi:hypothetical protein
MLVIVCPSTFTPYPQSYLHVIPILTLKIVIGVQHHKLAQILLSIFNPSIPKVGGSRSIAVRNMEVGSVISRVTSSFYISTGAQVSIAKRSRSHTIGRNKAKSSRALRYWSA